MAKQSIQDKLLPAMVVALIGAAFALGMMWGKVQVYEKGGMVGSDTQGIVDELIEPEEVVELGEEAWNSILVDPAYAMGDESAPVTIVEFTDYECPFCKRYVDETLSQIKTNYIDTGKVRYLVRDLPLSFHSNAKAAAVAARCAGDQGQYEACIIKYLKIKKNGQ